MVQFADAPSRSVAMDYLSKLARVVGLVPANALERAIDSILEARRSGHRVYVMGNGGSAATASHFVCDLVKTACVPGLTPVRAFALGDNTSVLTAWANDEAYEQIFAEQINALVDPGDVVIGISASGKSANIVAGFEAAKRRGARTIGLIGFDGGLVQDIVHVAIHVKCHDYGLVEDTHAAIGHAITAAVRATLIETRGE